MSDTYIHLQGSQACANNIAMQGESDTYIHLQGSQAQDLVTNPTACLIPIFTYKVLKQISMFWRLSAV